jgi:hypothetical protein
MLPTKSRFIWQGSLIHYQTWPSTGNSCFWMANFLKSPLKPLGQINRNFAGSIYGKQNVHSLERTFHKCFILSFSSFGWWVSEEKIKMLKFNRWPKQTTDAKWCQKPTLPLSRWAKKNIKMWIPNMALHRQFLFLDGQFFKISSETTWPN